MFIQHSSQEDRSQSTSQCPNLSASLSSCLTALLCQTVCQVDKSKASIVFWVSDNKTILSGFMVVGLSAWLLQSDDTWGKQGWERCASQLAWNLAFVASFQVLSAILPASAGFRMSKTLRHGLLRVTVESEGRGSPYSTPVRCQFSFLTQEIENRLYSFNAFIGNLSS